MKAVLGRVGVVVQMRLDSTRLPRKALLPFAGTSLAEAVMRRLIGISADARILATDGQGARELAGAAAAAGFQVFAGPKEDVLARYRLCADAFGLDTVVRATGDNPFVSVELAEALLDHAGRTGADYAGFTGMPVGMGVEVASVRALRLADSLATDRYDREHVCPFLYRNPGRFLVERPECPPAWLLPDARVTVDTEADYAFALAVATRLGANPSDADLLAFLRGGIGAGS